jgi:nitroreductase
MSGMTVAVPDAPEFGQPLPVEANEAVLAFMARRRSASALTLRAPGPTEDELQTLLRLAVRVPDHGKLSPWRFIVIEGEAKARIGAQLTDLAQARPDATKALAALGKYNAPPLAVCVVSHVKPGDIPEWEQLMSAGAVCASLLNAAAALGYGANWITDWYAFDDLALAAIGVGPDERVAGFLYIGTAAEAPLERVRPDVNALVTRP